MSPIYRPKTRVVKPDGKLSEFEQLLRESLSIYGRKARLILPVAAVLMMNSLILAGANYFVFRAVGLRMGLRSVLALLFWVAVVALTIYIYSICQVALLSALKEKGAPEIKKLFKHAKALALGYAKLYVYVRALIFMWMLPFIAAMVGLLVRHGQPFGSDAEIVSTISYALPLAIPGLIYILFYVFSSYVFVYEEKTVTESVRQSKRLVAKFFGPLFGKYALLLLLNLAIYYIVNWSIGFLPGEAAKQLLSRMFDSLIGPVYTIFGYLLYKEIKALSPEHK
ncbi:hypothetical protein HGA34_04035 [Candidatus Falkowbacteria bacterium]|nr:hypothetical protein [Candidatus Falkowbacteria bacterium]